MENKTQAMLNKEAYLASGKKIPICFNTGCTNEVIVRDWKYYSFKHMCGDCTRRIQKGIPPRNGVQFHKKNFCENKDGRFGFVCPVNDQFEFPNSVLHGDHIDGNHENNHPDNLQTVCCICHHMKGMKSGDFVSAKKGRKLS